MSVRRGAWKARLIVVGCLLLALPAVHAQNKPAAKPAETARANLAAKARALEARGRPDMAVQEWQQILLSDPDNVDALAGLARDYKLMGSSDLSNKTLDRLRKISPNDPNIADIELMPSTLAAAGQLRQAGELARQGRFDDAMRIYRQLYGDHPPNGDIALAYYKTLYGTSTGKSEAIAGMRALADRNPGDPRYAVQLGILLTYDQHTRPEGIRILEAHPADLDAQAGLRQALIWDSANPASAAELREFLKLHPQDKELASRLKQNELELAQMNSGIARTPAERAAFAALNAHRLDEAEKRFTDLLRREPRNGRVAAGMGFLRMQQRNFGEAVNYFTQAVQDGYKARTVEAALTTSRFWHTMDEATQAFGQDQFDVARARFRAALDINPRSTDALNGLAGLYTKQQQYSTAAGVYEQLIRVQPGSLDGWRGLFIAYAREDQYAKALAVSARFPVQVKVALNKDPDYLRTLAGIYQAQNRNADAQQVLALALSLPFPDNGATLLADTKLEYAGILLEAKRYPQAIALYSQVLLNDPSNVQAWMGLVSAHHELGQDSDAIGDVKKMPPAAYESALGDPGFLSLLGAIYQQANQYEVAQGLLERSEKLQIAAGGQPSAALELQLAAIYLLRNNADKAYALYRQVLAGHPDRADAWKGLIGTLAATNRNAQALDEISRIPEPVRKQLDADIDFVQTEAGLYSATGDNARAVQFTNRVEAYYAKLNELPPAKIDIQNAWLLYSIDDGRALYPALMRIGGRTDLTVEQREMVQDIWANWSVRRAAAALDNGNVQRAVDILDAASQAFPDNMTVRKAVAGGYARVGRAKEAVALFKTVPMQDASADDFEGAIGAALTANDKNQAELWLRQALDRFPAEPAVLNLAARFEQARGDNERAAAYYRASLAAMPKVSDADRLAHVLVYPEQSTKAHRAVTAADLQRLLNPDYEPFPKTTQLPPLPAYGPDPYNGETPVVLPQAQPSQPAPSAPPSGSSGPGSESQPVTTPVPNAAFDRGPSPYGAHVVLASWHRSRPVFLGENNFLSFGLGSPAAIRSSAIPSGVDACSQVEITANPPHSLASDAWKGLVLSLMAGDHNAEALAELNKIPPDVRRQLEADIEWVQGIAGLYAAVNDVPHANCYFKRADNFYALHPGPVPAGLEVQHASLLYNMKDDDGLYLLLQRLNARHDLTAAQRRQVETLWANWADRRAAGGGRNNASSGPVQTEQSATPPMQLTGRVNLPPSEENVASVAPDESQNSQPPPPNPSAQSSPEPANLRISSEPMGAAAAQAQVQFALETDSQLTQGSASRIHAAPNAPAGPLPKVQAAPTSSQGVYNVAQYTPSAQEAATGAYSAPRQQACPPQTQQACPQQPSTAPAKPKAGSTATRRRRKKKVQEVQPATQTLGNAPITSNPPPENAVPPVEAAPPQPAETQEQNPAQTTTGTGLTDQELEQRNLPPLRGPWVRTQRQAPPLSPREEAEMQLQAIESGYSGWLGGSSLVNYRSGDPGFGQLAAIESPFEASAPLGYHARIVAVARPVFLDAGQATGNATISVLEPSISGSCLVTIQEPIGTYVGAPGTTVCSPPLSLSPPAQQNAAGLGGELQFIFPHIAIAGGYTPSSFLVSTFTGRFEWKPGNGPFAFSLVRDSQKDTQLSYAGLRDPGDSTLSVPGQIWGGVVSNQGQIQFAHGDAQSGYYFAAGGQVLTGYHVEHNTRVDGNGGAYWRAFTSPEYGNLSVGANFFAMHYANNQYAFTHGMGGYFSPQAYFLGNVPFSWTGHYQNNWHYSIMGALGVQAFQENSTPLWPLAVDKPLETSQNNPMLPNLTSVSANYDFRSQVAYQIGTHWFAGGFLSANNTRSYDFVSVGFFVRFMFREQPSTATAPTGLFPWDGLRPFTVP